MALAAGPSAVASAEDLSVEQIVERTNQVAYYQGQDGRARVKMTISDDQGRTRTRAFVLIRRDDDPESAPPDQATGKQKMYVYFRRPADVNKMAFLVWKHPTEDDDRWLYLPALDLVKRIAASDERTSFVGSHFFYEDVSGRSPEEDHHELAKKTDTYYVVRNRPKDPTSVEFDHFDMWVHKKTFLPVRTEYFDATGERYRLYEALEVKTIAGYPTVMRSRMSDLRSGGSTLLEYDSVVYNLGVPEEIFTERYLRSPPSQYLR
ncbi:MAG: outer membrane lipoprotein-sorting protein [Deltaproteobacteria bacterium]|nr:outer membrane lipoprotein-sorting protein [Deltaproteobacteria bacterium]MBW2422396.1 outer membrane lipoprotein-sorting protein [Deltaproteobacteria bacterium]